MVKLLETEVFICLLITPLIHVPTTPGYKVYRLSIFSDLEFYSRYHNHYYYSFITSLQGAPYSTHFKPPHMETNAFLAGIP